MSIDLCCGPEALNWEVLDDRGLFVDREVFVGSAVLVTGSFVSMHEHKVLRKSAAFVAREESRSTLSNAATAVDDDCEGTIWPGTAEQTVFEAIGLTVVGNLERQKFLAGA